MTHEKRFIGEPVPLRVVLKLLEARLREEMDGSDALSTKLPDKDQQRYWTGHASGLRYAIEIVRNVDRAARAGNREAAKKQRAGSRR